MVLFKLREVDGRFVQVCALCDYTSPSILNGKVTEPSAGIKLHFMKKHKRRFK